MIEFGWCWFGVFCWVDAGFTWLVNCVALFTLVVYALRFVVNLVFERGLVALLLVCYGFVIGCLCLWFGHFEMSFDLGGFGVLLVMFAVRLLRCVGL